MHLLKIGALAFIFTLVPLITLGVSHEMPTVVQEVTFDKQIRLYALKYGQDEALARRIIQCESQGKENAVGLNFDASSTLPWSQDLGWWQINDFFHKKEALKLGFDITDKWQNLEYGFLLLKKRGTSPWRASQQCWSS